MTATAPPSHQRLLSIDALRGLVILFMLLDHVRETFFLHRQVADPMNIEITDPALFLGLCRDKAKIRTFVLQDIELKGNLLSS